MYEIVRATIASAWFLMNNLNGRCSFFLPLTTPYRVIASRYDRFLLLVLLHNLFGQVMLGHVLDKSEAVVVIGGQRIGVGAPWRLYAFLHMAQLLLGPAVQICILSLSPLSHIL
jgi:hypothetical protein